MKNARKAIIGMMMLGLFVIFFSVVFLGTVSDKITLKNKVNKIRNILQTASLSAVKYYIDEDNNTKAAENIARGIISQNKLGADINSSLEFTWHLDSDPNNLVVRLPSYNQKLFWFKILGWNDKNITNMSSKTNIVVQNPTDGFAPIAINGCNQTFTKGDTLELLLGSYDDYNDSLSSFFFPVWDASLNVRHSGNENNNFVDWATNGMGAFIDGNFNIDYSDDVNYTIVDDNSNAADIKKLATQMHMDSFNPINAAITILPCGTNKDDPVPKEGLRVKLTAIQCSPDATNCCIGPICSPMFCIFDDMANFFAGIHWTTSPSQCGKDYFKMDLTILGNKKAILEY